MKHKVNVESIPDEFKPLVKPKMSNEEVASLGAIILKYKIERFKNKYFGWYYARKNKKQGKKKV